MPAVRLTRQASELPGRAATHSALHADTCLGEDVARSFAAGTLDTGALAAIDAHVDECTTCQELILAAMESSSAGGLAPSGAIAASAPVSRAQTSFRGGSLVADRYRVVRFIGRGGMGEVYEAEDEMLGERVALKSLSWKLAGNSKAVRCLKSEVQLARRITHPNVCRVFDLGVHIDRQSGPDLHFLTMELCGGETLGQHVRRGPMPLEQAHRIAEQLLTGLREAHRAGVLHRDFKSDNVILKPSSETSRTQSAIITDFGLARAFAEGQEHVSTSHMLVGSAPYMAPEQVEGGQLTEAVDIYGFGVVLFEMLTGSLPFSAETPMATALKRLHRPAPSPSARLRSIPRCWDDFVARCLAKDPRKRFASADAALHALASLAESTDRGVLSAAPARRLLVAVCVLGAAAGAYAFSRHREPPAHADGSQARRVTPELGAAEPRARVVGDRAPPQLLEPSRADAEKRREVATAQELPKVLPAPARAQPGASKAARASATVSKRAALSVPAPEPMQPVRSPATDPEPPRAAQGVDDFVNPFE
jgi:hypothetical protein